MKFLFLQYFKNAFREVGDEQANTSVLVSTKTPWCADPEILNSDLFLAFGDIELVTF